MPWRTGGSRWVSLLHVVRRTMMVHKRDRLCIIKTCSTSGCACWADTYLHCVSMLSPFTQPVKPAIYARIVNPPGTFDFISICRWLLKIVTLTLDSKPSPIPRSSVPPRITRNGRERRRRRIPLLVRTPAPARRTPDPDAPRIELAPKMIVADAEISTPMRRVLAPK